MSAYNFRPLTRADLPMVVHWLGTLEVVRWWGDPKEQIIITQDLDDPLMRQWIVEHEGRAFAYLQDARKNHPHKALRVSHVAW
jgi:aminoglycoside 6'-N-acetyltransferase